MRPDAAEAEQMLAEAAEGRRPSAAQVYVPTQHIRYEPEARTGPETAAATPYPPMSGPTRVGAPYDTGSGHTPVPHGQPVRPTPRRRRLRAFALVVALAAILGGGTAVALQKWGQGTGQANGETSTSVTPSPTATDNQSTAGGLPASWGRVDDPLGFSLYLPEGWKRRLVGKEIDGLQQVDYTPDAGKHFVRIAVDTSPDFADAYAHQRDLEQQVRQRLIGYRTVSLKENIYRDREGSLWEYTWNAQPKDTDFPGPRRAIDQAYIDRDGTEYAIYMSSPAQDWETTRKQFRAVLQGWQPNPS
jgi:eukaryotic-like serine/threonine-protein kinase